jgi:hypothetical protein
MEPPRARSSYLVAEARGHAMLVMLVGCSLLAANCVIGRCEWHQLHTLGSFSTQA